MTTEPDFISHCDDFSCDLGHVEYQCPACGKQGDDYGELWFGRDEVYAGKVARFECDHCYAKLAMLKVVDGGYVVADVPDVMAYARSLLDGLGEEARQELFSDYCRYCGGPAGCHCWNDE